MTEIWIGIAGAAATTYLTRGAGALLGPKQLGPRALTVVALFAPALLAGLVLAAVAGSHWRDLDLTVVAGLAATVAVRLRFGGVAVPLVAAVLVTALVRLVT